MAGPKGKAGRKSKFTPLVKKRIIAAIREGSPFKHAATAAGISQSSLANYLAAARAATEGPLLEFMEQVHAAEAEAVLAKVALIHKAAAERDEVTVRVTQKGRAKETVTTTRRVFDWGAAAWWLERRHPKLFGRTDRLKAEHSGPHGGPIPMDLSRLTDAELAVFEQLAEKAAAAAIAGAADRPGGTA